MSIVLYHKFENNMLPTIGTEYWQANTITPTYPEGAYGKGLGDIYYPGVQISSKTTHTFGTSDFTIEFWVKLSANITDTAVLLNCTGDWNNDDPFIIILGYSGTNAVRFKIMHNDPSYLVASDVADIQHSTPLQVGVWTHLSMCRSGTNFYASVNGIVESTTTSNVTNMIEPLVCPGFAIQVNQQIDSSHKVAIDEYAVWDECKYTSNFTPQSLSGMKLFKHDNVIYGVSSGIFGQVISDWSSLSDSQKEQAFADYSVGNISSSDFTGMSSPYSVLVYNSSSTQPNCKLSAIPTSKTLVPSILLDISNYSSVSDITLTATQSGNGVIKIAVTKDLANYYAYSGGSFVQISDITTEGSTITEINSATTAWSTFLGGASGVAFMLYLSQQASTDTASIDKIEITGNISGGWKSAQEYTDFTYEYPSNTKLKVKFITTGDYKVNYPS